VDDGQVMVGLGYFITQVPKASFNGRVGCVFDHEAE
jgi:hypothetical protein